MDAFERAARRELDAPRIGFRIHLAVYIGVQLLLFATWFLTSRGEGMPWFLFPLLGWGAGLAAHYAAHTALRRRATARWERPAA